MRERSRAGQAGAITLAVAAALLGAPLDTEAKGRSRLGGGGNVGKNVATPAKGAATDEASTAAADKVRVPGSGTHLTLRPGSSPRASAKAEAAPTGRMPVVLPGSPRASEKAEGAAPGRVHVVLPGPVSASEAGPDPEELARRAAVKASAEKAAAEQAAAEERVEAARVAAAAQHKKQEKASLHAEVEQVLERARNDYPVLRTEQGEPLLRSIKERQKVLQAGGLYPSIAMVEAVADHSDALRPRVRARSEALSAQPEGPPDYSKTYGTCRWVEPYIWSCK